MSLLQAVRERTLYAQIVRIDQAKREVELIATSEAVDSFGTRFGYAASCDAFDRALGNVREMHANKAVGKIVGWVADATQRCIRVTVYISTGAEDTWQKILDGTLKGASIGASNVRWQNAADGVPTATYYDLVELSLVDNPSNPDCKILVARGRSFMQRAQAQRAGSVIPNSLTSLPTNAPDVITSTTAAALGKLSVATSSDPKAPDYGVPPVVTVSDSRGNDGTDSYLDGNVGTGAVYPGGHPGGVTVQPGQDPMPENDQSFDANVGDPTVDVMTPMHWTYPAGGAQAMPMRQQRPLATRDGGEAGDGGAAGGATVTAAVSPQWHRVARSAVNHAAGVMDACGCPTCAGLSRAMRDASAGAYADGGGVTDTAGGVAAGTAAAAHPQTTRTTGADAMRVADALGQITDVLAGLTSQVERMAAQPQAGGPVAMQVRGFQQLPVEQQAATITDFSRRSNDPHVQMEAAAAILRLQRGE